MDKRISYKMVIDTETCPLDKSISKVTPSNMFVYDIGYAIVDKHGKVYKTQSFVIDEIFCDFEDLMNSSYYASKIPQYWEDLRTKTRRLVKWYDARRAFLDDIKEWGITDFYAHNMPFDCIALNNTQRYLTKSKYRYFFPYEANLYDTLKMARDVLKNRKSYKTFFREQGKRVSYSAENIYRYLIEDDTFTESHTGLEDVLIEKDIMAFCYRQKKAMRKEAFPNRNKIVT